MSEEIKYVVTELSSHRDKYANEYEEVLYGDDYVKHEFESKAEAQSCEAELKAQGITTTMAEVHYCR